jgi:hypothetical protein
MAQSCGCKSRSKLPHDLAGLELFFQVVRGVLDAIAEVFGSIADMFVGAVIQSVVNVVFDLFGGAGQLLVASSQSEHQRYCNE